MGKGDRRTKRGKIWRGTTGKTRPKTWKGRKTQTQKDAKEKA
ncbi:30S ribosomal protein S31 [Geothermobacter ehrlichii]|uniref:30S ribosomal protein S31 n=1 Tax=Geothermobacter ehrlichii TaxID=213224 RepID=A0A5D3WNX0_9BACT|nr:30S ribosomal protein THX [Geothermobacter ehrlichii]TYO99059.1 30S ribosomal protein S31 [Geothermobacter ehrlichii]